MQDVQLDLVIPAYNEEFRIRRTLEDYLSFFGDGVRITVVINNTNDNTSDVVRSVQKKHPSRVRLLEDARPIGKGGAIMLGWNSADRELVGFVDADGATSAREFQKLIEALPGMEGVIGSRFMPDSKVIDRESSLRRVMSRGFIFFVRRLFGLPFSDFQCGAKVFRTESSRQALPHIHTSDMTFDVDLLWRLSQTGAAIAEVPTVWVDQPGSATMGSKMGYLRTAFKMLLSLLQLRFSKQKK